MSCFRSPATAASSKSMEEFCIPEYIFKPDAIVPEGKRPPPSCPVIVFINSRSGGQLGGALLQTYADLLNSWQVFDLTEEAPDKVLHSLYLNLETRKISGDELAKKIYKSLKLIVAGGDGTAGWLLSVVSDLKLTRPPPIATMPLGTGNNLHFAFGWGKKNPGTDRQSVKVFLDQVKNAKELKIDSWHIIMRMRDKKEGSCDPNALELPHSLHAFHRVSKEDSSRKDGYCTFRGGFWNYFSMGMDAQVSYAFHSERKLHPEKFKKQLFNQITYLKLGFGQRWFCHSLAHNSSRNILADVEIVRTAGQMWEKLEVPKSIRSIVCLNLPSFSGGFNPWGTPNKKKSRDRNLTPTFVNDGLLEIVGFRHAWHGLLLLSSKGHGTRIAQAHRIRFKLRKGVAGDTYMRIDGEPWKQPLPKEDDDVVVEISHQGQVNMLATANCQSKSKSDDPMSPSPSSSKPHYDYESDEFKEEKKKFGAADSFKVPKDDIATHLAT